MYTALTHALNDGLNVIKTLKTIELKRAQDDLFTADKIARLRSGARGFDARKFLRVQEKATEDARHTESTGHAVCPTSRAGSSTSERR
jgi:hypothetical protein